MFYAERLSSNSPCETCHDPWVTPRSTREPVPPPLVSSPAGGPMPDHRLERLDANRLRIRRDAGVAATLFANEDVPVENTAVEELCSVLRLEETVATLHEQAPDFLPADAAVRQVAVTPDFHKGAGIPVGTVLATRGFVVPQAIGNDINCGMRLHVTSLSGDDITGQLDAIEQTARHLYFEGGRQIPMSRSQREAMFRDGLLGLLD